jgi:hypothetical protein
MTMNVLAVRPVYLMKSRSEAAGLVGLPSYQTLNNWLKRYDVEGDDA